MSADQGIEALTWLYEQEKFGDQPKEKPKPSYVPFRPKLNPVQGQFYDSKSKFILAHGERASGKGIGALHKLVNHCREYPNAQAVVIIGVRRQATLGGAWEDLKNFVLPQWKDGCGLEYTDERSDTSKDLFIWIANRHGGWSKVVLLSMPVEGFIPQRFRGPVASFILIDEAQSLDSDNYFKVVVQQVGRRRGIPGDAQQVVYCCNPAGPSHWLYRRFFINPIDQKTGKVDTRYSVFHIPIAENKHNLPEGYYENNVLEATRDDDIEYRRMVLGEWIDAPEGEALFKEDFKPDLHVKGDAIHGVGIKPFKGVEVVMGWDLGSAHHSIHLQQLVAESDSKPVWVVFDEIVLIDSYMDFPHLVPKVIDRMRYWETVTGSELRFVHISDSSAFNQWRATDGSFDVQTVERLSQDYVTANKLDERFVIRMRQCPKARDSVIARVRATKDLLRMRAIRVSATCVKTVEMFQKLEEDPKERLKPRKDHRWDHLHDSLTYPHHYFNARGGPRIIEEQRVEPAFYAGRI